LRLTAPPLPRRVDFFSEGGFPRMKVVTPLAVAALAVSLGIVPAARAAGDGKVATVGEHAITRAQLEEHVRAKLIELENQRYEMLREGLDELIAEELLKQEASARKTTPADLEKQEVAAKVPEPTDEEIQKVYDANKAQRGSQTLEQIKPRIVEYLKQQGMQRRRPAFVEELKEYAKNVRLDAAKFDQCLKDKPFKAAIDKDVADGEKVGVNGTPAFFINGRMLSGALPFDKFKEVIDEELTAKGASSS